LFSILLAVLPTTNHVSVHVESKFEGSELVAHQITKLSETDSHTYYIASEENWQATDPTFKPETIYIGPSGEHLFSLSGDVIVTGGWFKACYANTVRYLVFNSEKPLRIIIPMKMVFHGHTRTLYDYYQTNYKDKDKDREFIEYIRKTAVTQFQMHNPRVLLDDDTLTITYIELPLPQEQWIPTSMTQLAQEHNAPE